MEQAAAMDYSKYELEELATLTVQNAKGNDDMIGADGKNPVTIELYGSASKQAIKAQHKVDMAVQMRMQQMMRNKVDKRAAEIAEEEQVEKLVAVTKSINNFGPITSEELYSNPRFGYITRQVLRFQEDDANFAKGSGKN